MSEVSEKVRAVTGVVISNKMDKTTSVLVERVVQHPVYGKYIRRSTKLLAHDEENRCKEGDLVSITPCRPISKRKSWKVDRIIESSEV